MKVTLQKINYTNKICIIIRYEDYYGEPITQKAYSPEQLFHVLTTIKNIYGSLFVKQL